MWNRSLEQKLKHKANLADRSPIFYGSEGVAMQMTTQKYGYSKTVKFSFSEALERTKKALQEQGFGIQAEINISGALREKLGVELPAQIILGACNPQLAYKALQSEPEISLLLPCNVTVRQNGPQVEVTVIDAHP